MSITNEEAIAIVEDHIVTKGYTADEWVYWCMCQDQLYYLLEEPHGFQTDKDDFQRDMDALEIKLFGKVVCQ